MEKRNEGKSLPPHLGSVEPNPGLLKQPTAEQLLYKMMTIENLLCSFACSYLHFNRVDKYRDFPGADAHDGEQPPKDRQVNETIKIMKAPSFSADNYYDNSRSRTYACCFSLNNSEVIWKNYANDSGKGKVCVVFNFGKLRATLNKILEPGNAILEYEGTQIDQILSLNYGEVEYVDWEKYRNLGRAANPSQYACMKDNEFSLEKEFRIVIWALGIGIFKLYDGSVINFPDALSVFFDFRAAIANGTIRKILCGREKELECLNTDLYKMRILPHAK